jgi:RNA polymerase sigma-70 factor (ECF subfamily)
MQFFQSMQDNLDTLFRQHHNELYSLAYRQLGRCDMAADVVQDAFVRYADMAKSDAGGEAVEQPRLFLCRIVANLVIDLARRDRRRGAHAVLDDVADHVADRQPAPDKALETRQRLTLLRAALDELPPSCRDALLLSRVAELTHAEVAERLGVSCSMVSKNIMRALRHCERRVPRQ